MPDPTHRDPLWQEFLDDTLKHPELEFGTWQARRNWSESEKAVALARDNSMTKAWKSAVCIKNPNPDGEPAFVLMDSLQEAAKDSMVQEWGKEHELGFRDVKVCVDGPEIIVDFGNFKMRIRNDRN